MKIIKKIVKICKYLVISLLAVILALNIINIVQSIVLGQEMPLIFGYGRAIVITGSMEPAILPGDMVIIHEQDGYEVGDIVVYKANSYITHRIVEETENGYITQGDANNAPDKEILESQIIGRVVLVIPKVGYITEFVKSPFGMLILIAALFLMIELPVLAGKIRKRR